MPVALACAWKPRGEPSRFRALQPLIAQHYIGITVSVPPDCPTSLKTELSLVSGTTVVQPTDWAAGRHAAVFAATGDDATHVHYVDFERLLRWFALMPDEIPSVLAALQQTDCLIIGRTDAALATHAQALQQTERLTNSVFSHILGQSVDLGGGSRGFSRRAVEFLKRHSSPEQAIGTDASWPVLLHRASFDLRTITVDGLTWEVPDHYKSQATSVDEQRTFAERYDQDASRWALRVQTAQEILDAGLYALKQPLTDSGTRADLSGGALTF
jgi:hypothetical protein